MSALWGAQRGKRRIRVNTVNECQDGTDAKNVHSFAAFHIVLNFKHVGNTYTQARLTGAACTYRLTVGEYYGLLPACLRRAWKFAVKICAVYSSKWHIPNTIQVWDPHSIKISTNVRLLHVVACKNCDYYAIQRRLLPHKLLVELQWIGCGWKMAWAVTRWYPGICIV